MKTKNKLLLIVMSITVVCCHNLYAQKDSIYIFTRGKLVKNGLIDNQHQFFLHNGGPLTQFDTLFIHLPPIYQKYAHSDSIKFTFKDVAGRPIDSGYAYIDIDRVVWLTNLNQKKLFILKRNDGRKIHWYAIRLYFGNSSKYIVLVTGK